MNAVLLPPFALYVRKSDTKSDLDRQIRLIDTFTTDNDFTVVPNLRYLDSGSRDKSTSRPEFNRMLADAEAGLFRTLLISDLDRFGIEDASECISYMHKLRKLKVRVYSVDSREGDLTENTDQNLINLFFRGQASKKEQIDKGKRAITGKAKRLAQGASFQGGPTPYGYDKECAAPNGDHLWTIHYQGETRTPHPERPGQEKVVSLRLQIGPDGVERRCDGDKTTHPVKRTADVITLVPSRADERVRAVKAMFDLWTNQDLSILAVCKKLNALGYRHYGDTWQPTAVRGILSNPVYIGQLTFNRKKVGRFVSVEHGREVHHEGDDKAKKYTRDRDAWITVPDAHPALIDSDTFAKSVEKLDALKGTHQKAPRRPELWLRRFCVCGHCGKGMQARRIGKHDYLICGLWKADKSNGKELRCTFNSVRHDVVEREVERQFGEIFRKLAGTSEAELIQSVQQYLTKYATALPWQGELYDRIEAHLTKKYRVPEPTKKPLEPLSDRRAYFAGKFRELVHANPDVRAEVDDIIRTHDATVHAKLRELEPKFVTVTERAALADDDQYPILKAKSDELSARIKALKASLSKSLHVSLDLFINEAQQFVKDIRRLQSQLSGGSGHAKSQALQAVLTAIKVRFKPKTGPKAKSRMDFCDFVFCDSNNVRATAYTAPRTGRPVRAG